MDIKDLSERIINGKLVTGTSEELKTRKITGTVYKVLKKWSFGKLMIIILEDKNIPRLTFFIAYRFPFKEPLDFNDMPDDTEELETVFPGDKFVKKKKLDKKYGIDWYKYFFDLQQQKVNIDLFYREYEVRRKKIIEIIAVTSNSGPIACRFM